MNNVPQLPGVPPPSANPQQGSPMPMHGAMPAPGMDMSQLPPEVLLELLMLMQGQGAAPPQAAPMPPANPLEGFNPAMMG